MLRDCRTLHRYPSGSCLQTVMGLRRGSQCLKAPRWSKRDLGRGAAAVAVRQALLPRSSAFIVDAGPLRAAEVKPSEISFTCPEVAEAAVFTSPLCSRAQSGSSAALSGPTSPLLSPGFSSRVSCCQVPRQDEAATCCKHRSGLGTACTSELVGSLQTCTKDFEIEARDSSPRVLLRA